MKIKNIVIIAIALIPVYTTGGEESSISQYQKLLAADPFNNILLFKLANTYLRDNQCNEAIYCYQKLISRNPQDHCTLFNVALAYMKNNNTTKALEYFTKVIDIKPDYIKKYFNKNEDYQEAIQVYKILLAKNPTKIGLRFQLSNMYIKLGNSKEAIKELEKILEWDPKNYKIMHNIAYCLKVAGRVDEAIDMYKQAIEINPTYEESMYALALAYLSKGDFENGWKQYSLRLKKEKRNAEHVRIGIKENNLHGKKIFLMPEGGLGDTIQFIRYAEILKSIGAHVTVLVQKPLKPLLSHCPYIDNLVVTGQNFKNDWQDRASIMSLPAIFESNERSIPINIPYIYPDENLIEKWGQYFKKETQFKKTGFKKTGFKIGLCWQADVKNDISRLPVARRSIPLIKLEKLSSLKNVTFYSLQKSNGALELENLPENFVVHTFGPDFDETAGPFMDTAAIITHLDLVITVDTSIAHLAGALGKPVWVMLPYNTDWRWIVNRTDSPWYPKMKIFKQAIPFDWDSIVTDIFENLKDTLRQ